MTALQDNPSTLNFLNPLNFSFIIKRAPSIEFFIQKVNLPELALATIVQPTGIFPINRPGRIKFGDFTLHFKIDENLTNYLAIYNWMMGLGFPETFDQYASIVSQPIVSGNGIVSDMGLLMLNGIKNPTFEFLMRDAYPIGLSAPLFDTTNPDVQYVTAIANFRYVTMDIIPYTYAANTGVP
jgi:hypothetical protein